ncbi:MAG: GH92 family glycosyl hydrolase [Bacteroidota bacterium]|nr:GH92 family glycosyl hydrolase [Bacteroidota bacterium]
MKTLFNCLIIIFAITFSMCSDPGKNSPVSFVDPFIGTDAHGHTYPGASLPFGMVQLSPDTRTANWDACSGYHSSDNSILGFSHKHLSGTGAMDYGDIRIMPTQGEVFINPGNEENPEMGYRCSFRHESEKASPGYYAVKLNDYNIDVELTATKRTGFHKYKINSGGAVNFVLDLKDDIGLNEVLASGLTVLGNNEIAGYRNSKGWAKNQQLFFVVQFSKPFDKVDIAANDKFIVAETKADGQNIKAVINFNVDMAEEILIKVAVSSVSINGARKNLEAENPGWDFYAVKKQAEKVWNDALSSIRVKGSKQSDKVVFYTALYHSLLAPNVYCDVDMQYRGMDMKIHKADHNVYTVFSLWDTFRATHPLFTIIDPAFVNDLIKTMLTKYDESGLLPVWELSACETGCMIGYHSIPVIADAYVKGITDYDVEKAYEAMKTSAMQDKPGLEFYKSQGFIPIDKEHEGVSKTLEYAYDDWCIATIAKALGKKDDYDYFINRAQFYKNVFDTSTGFMRGKKNGKFVEPFDPYEVSGDFTEANSWQYSFFAPHDVSGLMQEMGGKEKFVENLDKLFSADNKITGRSQPDISGLIGQYAHGNEPSHHISYLYNYAGKAWKTQEIVNKITSELYSANRDGLCGNEDCGQMSSWYVFSALGFYPVTPASVDYAIGTPKFEEAVISLKNENTFSLIANKLSSENIYIQSAKLNGKEYTRSFITHSDILQGGTLVFEMGPKANKEWGAENGNMPVSSINEKNFVEVPVFVQAKKIFQLKTIVELAKKQKQKVYYTLDGSNPDENSMLYSKAFEINKSTIIKVISIDGTGNKSMIVEAVFTKIPEGRSIDFINPYSHIYTAGGELALIDQNRGTNDFRSGEWQGWEGTDLEAVIDLGKMQTINSLTLSCLQAQEIWILLPKQVEFFISDNGMDFKSTGVIRNKISAKKGDSFIHEFSQSLNGVKTRYIKVQAINFGKLPQWHRGAGGDAWIFADEIVIR